MYNDKTLQELIAVLLRTTPDSDVVMEVTARYSTPRNLYHASVEELMAIKGISTQKALLLKIALELGFRIATAPKNSNPSILSPTDAYDLIRHQLEFLNKEHFMVLLLNTKNRVISVETISIGSLNSSIVHPREIFNPAIRKSAAAIILAHNHPSGDPTPSREDVEVTKRIVEAGDIIGIKVLDHIIVGDGSYLSFKEQGLI